MRKDILEQIKKGEKMFQHWKGALICSGIIIIFIIFIVPWITGIVSITKHVF
jgi:hypothetical protein